MRRLLFILTLALYGFTAMDLHEWVRVPEVVLHLLEHHSDLGHHHHGTPAEHGHDEGEGHNPFGQDGHAACGASSLVSLPVDQCGPSLIIPAGIALCVPVQAATSLSDYSGSKWNPPKQA